MQPGPDGGELLLIGRVARAHGIRGQVIVNPETDFPDERFAPGRVVYVTLDGTTVAREMTAVRFHQGRPVVQFEGVASMNEAEALAGAELAMPVDALGELPPETYYRHDLVGCEVTTTDRVAVGKVTAVEGSLERSRLVVAGTDGEVLIPMVDAICVKVDIAAKSIVVDPPPGLLDVNAPPKPRADAS